MLEMLMLYFISGIIFFLFDIVWILVVPESCEHLVGKSMDEIQLYLTLSLLLSLVLWPMLAITKIIYVISLPIYDKTRDKVKDSESENIEI